MADVIEYTLIKKSKYTDVPSSYGALHKYLAVKRKSKSDDDAPPAPTSPLRTPSAVSDNVSSSSVFQSLNQSHHMSPTAITNHFHDMNMDNASILLSVADSVPFSTSHSNDLKSSSFSHACNVNNSLADNNNLNESRVTSNNNNNYDINNTSKRSAHSFLDDVPIVIDDDDAVVQLAPVRVSLTAQVADLTKKFVILLLSDVKDSDEKLCLKLNTRHNAKVTQNLALMKFFETNTELDDVAIYDLFCSCNFFKSLSCAMYIPFLLEDQYNIVGDGYCFYRTLFMLLLRQESGFVLPAEQLSIFDKQLKTADNDGDQLRIHFQHFFTRIEELFPDINAKAKVAAASCTFSNLSTYLDERFWGGTDSVPFLDFVCTAFSYTRDEAASLTGCWAKMYCSSIPGMVNGRESLNVQTVGDAYSLHDILMVVMRPHNWLLHKNVHFFLGDHPSVEVLLESFANNLSSILSQLRLRVTVAKGENSATTFTDVYDRMVSGNSTTEDISWLIQAQQLLECQLSQQNYVFGGIDDEDSSSAPTNKSTNKPPRECFLATPFGATQEQKIYISTINNTVSV
jgi:hypothetical protein